MPQGHQIQCSILLPAAQEVHRIHGPTLTGDILAIKTFQKT